MKGKEGRIDTPLKTPINRVYSSPRGGTLREYLSPFVQEDNWFSRRAPLYNKTTMKKSDLINCTKEELIKLVKQYDTTSINCQQDSLAWMDFCKKIQQENINIENLYSDSALRLKSYREKVKHEKATLKQYYEKELDRIKEIFINEKQLLINQTKEEKEISSKEIEALKTSLNLSVETTNLLQVQLKQVSNECNNLNSNLQQFQLEKTTQINDYEERINQLKKTDNNYQKKIEDIHNEYRKQIAEMTESISLLQTRLDEEISKTKYVESPLHKLETMSIRAQVLRSRNEQLESKLSESNQLELTNQRLEKDFISFKKDKDIIISKLRAEFTLKQQAIEREFQTKLEQEKENQIKLQAIISKLNQELRDKGSKSFTIDSQKPIDTLKQKNEELNQDLIKQQHITKTLESDIRIIHQQHQAELKQIDSKYKQYDYKILYTNVLQEKKEVEAKLSKSLSIIHEFEDLQNILKSTCTLTSVLAKGIEQYKQKHQNGNMQEQQQKLHDSSVFIVRLLGINKAEKLAREALQRRITEQSSQMFVQDKTNQRISNIKSIQQ